MKYSNSLKYMCGFPLSGESIESSQRRLRALCQQLGRVELGVKYIAVPEGSAGFATATMLASVIRSAGHYVGLITSEYGYDPRASVMINGAPASIEDFNSSVIAVKSAVNKLWEESFCREETVIAMGLLLCKLNACEYVILQGLSGKDSTLDAVCAPFDLIVTPTVYGTDKTEDRLKSICDLIRRGSREVISGNQKSEVYNTISNACAVSGARLGIPVKAQFKITDITARSAVFSYGDREGFTIKSPSRLLREVAMTVIEAALALRRGGVKLPWSSISGGLADVVGTHCFELLSVSPLVIIDSASDCAEVEMLLGTVEDIFGDGSGGVSVCIPRLAMPSLAAFGDKKADSVLILSAEAVEAEAKDGEIYFDSVKKCAKEAVRLMKSGKSLMCFGSVAFAAEIKAEINKIIN